MVSLNKSEKIIITGAAGLLGMNLITELLVQGYTCLVALDKHAGNLSILQQLHPQVTCIHADLSECGSWGRAFEGASRLFLLQAQITGTDFSSFQKNTLDSTSQVLEVAKKYEIPFTICIGSSVVNSVVDDNYTRSKKQQEVLMKYSGLDHCVVRPTLMFGWFDPKHFGWLSRFMTKIPVFPIPGNGKFLRQPLYVRDFCRILVWCLEHVPRGKIFDIVGQENVDYIDIIKSIKKVKKTKTLLLTIPVSLFRMLLHGYGFIFKNPPFVPDQLDALMAGDYFTGDNMRDCFGVEPTPFVQAIEETFNHPEYSKVTLERWI